MILIKPDHHRRIEIPGVQGPVRRPVDIDQATTGFMSLRTLRIYRFDSGSVIEGHAEEDEVFIVVLAGSIELTMTVDPSQDVRPVTLSAPTGSHGVACAAYLPPQAAYKLISSSESDVAYARATPPTGRPPKVFTSVDGADSSGAQVMLEEMSYAERLQLRLVRFDARNDVVALEPSHAEALVHVKGTSPEERIATITGNDLVPVSVDSWDTVATSPDEQLVWKTAMGSTGLIFMVAAR